MCSHLIAKINANPFATKPNDPQFIQLCEQDFSKKVGFSSSDQRHYSTYNSWTFCPNLHALDCPAIEVLIHNCKASKRSSLRLTIILFIEPSFEPWLKIWITVTNEILLKNKTFLKLSEQTLACCYLLKLNTTCVTKHDDMYQIRRPLGLVFVIYFWWLGELLLLYI